MAKKKQKIPREVVNSFTPPPYTYPAISVIIPLYNVEKYVGECLDSLLAQTFKNFEIIVVDDCSTDNSASIVESYIPKFAGRLKLTRTKKNSGGCAVPRNVGLPYSRGEYIYFMDSDDAITPTALEELYTLAKKFDADVVHCEKYYPVPENFRNDSDFRQYLKPYNYLTGERILVREPVIWDNNFEERVKNFAQRKLIWNIFVQLIRRDIIIDNEIHFGNIFAEDMLFSMCELCCAKRYVVVPNVIYYYRVREGSITNSKNSAFKLAERQLKALTFGIHYLDEFLSNNEFFSRRPDLRYILFDTFVNQMVNELTEIYTQVPAHVLDEQLRKEFSAGDNVALTSFIFNAMNVYRLKLLGASQKISELEAALRARQ